MEPMHIPKKSLAILNCVVDHLYDGGKVKEDLMDAFLHAIPNAMNNPDMDVPRTDDTLFMPASAFDSAAGKAVSLSQKFTKAAHAHHAIFGEPKLAPGGSLANTMASIHGSKLHGLPLYEGKILTNLSEGETGQVFKDSFEEGVVYDDVIQGECLNVHVVPYQGGRSQFTTFSDTNPANTNLSPHIFGKIKDGNFDTLFIEGFLADHPDFENMAKTIITAVGNANVQRDTLYGRPPMEIIISAGAQHICNNPTFREFVREAAQISTTSIHANTGEFRRLMDHDTAWRKEAEADFHAQGLVGKTMDAAKKTSAEYRAAKTAANIDSIQKFINELGNNTEHKLEAIVTDGGHTGYVINNDHYLEHQPKPLDADTIVNKVGAGDAFTAFYRLGRELGFSQEKAMQAGDIGAQHTMAQEEARPKFDKILDGISGPMALLVEHGLLNFSTPPLLEVNYPEI